MRPHTLKLLGLLLMAAWTAALVLSWNRSPTAALGLLAVGVLYVLWSLRRARAAGPRAQDSARSEQEARFVVTRMLGELTKIQVAYLGQRFDSPDEGRRWLKGALHRSYRPMLDQMLGDLEAARAGNPPGSLELAMRVHALRGQLRQADHEIQRARAEHPGHALASPVIFVITESIGARSEAEPLVVTLASLDPRQATLLPAVDVVNLFTESDGQRLIRGQIDFEALLQALGDRAVQVADDLPVYAVAPSDEPLDVGHRLSRPPLGFVVGAGELV
jgi:hypothetical protein